MSLGDLSLPQRAARAHDAQAALEVRRPQEVRRRHAAAVQDPPRTLQHALQRVRTLASHGHAQRTALQQAVTPALQQHARPAQPQAANCDELPELQDARQPLPHP